MRGNNPNKNTSKNHQKGEVVKKVLLFLKTVLPFFSSETTEIKKGDDEWNLNAALFGFLNGKRTDNDAQFRFIQEPQPRIKGNSSKVDLGVREYIKAAPRSSRNPFFTIECKRLKRPPSKSKFYVCSSSTKVQEVDGIERFKANKHGIDLNGNLLKSNAMIGYVEDENFDFWLTTINNWIAELIEKGKHGLKWLAGEKLKKKTFDKIAVLESKHLRVNKETVELTHFWIKMA